MNCRKLVVFLLGLGAACSSTERTTPTAGAAALRVGGWESLAQLTAGRSTTAPLRIRDSRCQVTGELLPLSGRSLRGAYALVTTPDGNILERASFGFDDRGQLARASYLYRVELETVTLIADLQTNELELFSDAAGRGTRRARSSLVEARSASEVGPTIAALEAVARNCEVK